MAIAQSIEEMREKMRKELGDDVDTICEKCIKEYYMGWYHGGSGGCACKWEDGNCSG